VSRRTKIEALLDKAIAISEALRDLDVDAENYMQDYQRKRQTLNAKLNKVMTMLFKTRKQEWSGKMPNNNKRKTYTV
jgi:hypothetical protein